MKIIFFGKGKRALSCLRTLCEKKIPVSLVVTLPEETKEGRLSVAELASRHDIEAIMPENPNTPEIEKILKSKKPDLFVIGGYSKILKQHIIDIPRLMCLNLHGGKLPEYRGSSPLNWALINGESTFTVSIIKVDAGVDTGDILHERTFDISNNDTIKDLHETVNRESPLMLLETIDKIEKKTYTLKPQDNSKASYYPLRFPDDGLILWDMFTAPEVHNRIRALTEPYPCAFTFYGGRKVKLLSSELRHSPFFGTPGRIYLKSKKNGVLTCARDRCLWIKKAVFEDTGEDIFPTVSRYDIFSTTASIVLSEQRKQAQFPAR